MEAQYFIDSFNDYGYDYDYDSFFIYFYVFSTKHKMIGICKMLQIRPL